MLRYVFSVLINSRLAINLSCVRSIPPADRSCRGALCRRDRPHVRRPDPPAMVAHSPRPMTVYLRRRATAPAATHPSSDLPAVHIRRGPAALARIVTESHSEQMRRLETETKVLHFVPYILHFASCRLRVSPPYHPHSTLLPTRITAYTITISRPFTGHLSRNFPFHVSANIDTGRESNRTESIKAKNKIKGKRNKLDRIN